MDVKNTNTKINQSVPKVRLETTIITCSEIFSSLLFSVDFNKQNMLVNNNEIQTRREK